MKSVIAILALSFATSAQALEVYNCDFTAVAKANEAIAGSKKTFLSSQFSNAQDFGHTSLVISVRDGALTGTVNGQPNFVLSGTPDAGVFESAYVKGKIACAAPVQVAYMLQFKPWKQYYTLDKSLSKGHILQTADIGQLHHENICFIGDAQATADAIAAQGKIKTQVVDAYRVNATFDYTSCVSGRGSYDDFTCDKYETKTETKTLLNCNGDGWVDPRS